MCAALSSTATPGLPDALSCAVPGLSLIHIFPDAESYLWQLQNNFIRMTDQECHLPEAGLEKQAQVMFAALAKVGALEVLEDG